nr:hypothetical protein [Tanacetum cinerariifolium]
MSVKMARKPYTHQVEREKDLLGLIHTDVCGPFKIMSRQGASYFITFTDDFSCYGYVYLLKHKHEVFETLKVFQKEVENQLDKIIKSLCIDRGGQYISKEFLDHLKDHGIISHRTPPYTPQHNGLSERRNRTLLDMVEKTTYEVWHGQAPKLSYLKFLGCEALVKRDTLTKPDKLEPRSIRTRRAPDCMCLYIDVDEHELGDLGEPANYKAALVDSESEKWLNAMNVEMQSMKDNKVWVLVELPPNGKTVGSKWPFKKKTNMDGVVHTYKARLLAKGYTQTLGIDYEETFSPVADIRAIRILIAIAAYYDYEILRFHDTSASFSTVCFFHGYLLFSRCFVVPVRHYRINLSQLSDIAAAKVSHFEILCRVHGEPTVGLFRCFYVNSKNKGLISFTKRSDSDAVCYTKPTNSLKYPFRKSTEFSADDYAVLVAHPSTFRKFLDPFLCLIKMSRNYTLDEDTYPTFLDHDGTKMDLFAFIQVVNPTKSELEASAKRLFDEGGSADHGDSAAGGGQDTSSGLVTGVKMIVADNLKIILLSAVVQPVMTEAVVTSHAVIVPLVPKTNTTVTSPVHASLFQDSDSTDMVKIREMDYHHLFTEFNVGIARQVCLNAKVRMRTEYCLSERKRLESENVSLENENETFDRKVAELQSSVFTKDLELKDLYVAVHALETTCFGLRDYVSGYERLKEQIEEFQDVQMNIVNDKVATLDADLLEMALHL